MIKLTLLNLCLGWLLSAQTYAASELTSAEVTSTELTSTELTSTKLSSTQLTSTKFCPLPSQSDVSYSSVLGLPARQPDHIISYGGSEGSGEFQFSELWLPESIPSTGAPIVALVHGGCWLNEYDVQHTHALSSALAQMGYAVWALEYRRTGDMGGGWPGSLNDVIMGLNSLTQQTLTELDFSKVALVGHSAGGHLALLAAANEQLTLGIDVVIGLAPIVDVAEYAAGNNSCQQATPKFMGGKPNEKEGDYKLATPRLEKVDADVIALHGNEDAIVPLHQSSTLPQTIVDGAGHFDFIHTATPAFQALLKTLANHL